ncbi:MAG: TolC family protein [Chitinophagaceae bacterium]|nr:TolC family protein [Chitinophagaceae bacterium]
MVKNYIIPVFIIVLAASCKIPEKLSRQPELEQPPAGYFNGSTDSATIGDLSYQQLFTDPVLNNLIDTMLAYNFELRQADKRIEMAQASFLINSRLNRPTLDAMVGAQADKFGFYTMNGIGNFDMNKSENITPDMRVPDPFVPDLFIGVRSRWEIDLWGRMRAMRKASQQRLFAEQTGRQWLQTQLVAELSTLYFEWIALRYEQEVIDRNVKLQENALEIVKALKAGGRATELAVQQFSAQVYRTSGLRFVLGQQIAVAENRMNYLCGRFPASLSSGMPIMQQQLPEVVKAGIPSGLLSRRPDIKMVFHEFSAAFNDVEAARAAFLPALAITPYFGLQGFKLPAFFNAESITTGLAAQLGAPLLARRQIRGQYAIANAELDRQWLEYKRIFREAVAEVQTSLQAILNLQQQFELKNKELEVLRAAVTTSNDLFTTGYANYLEVITAQQGLLEADIELVQIKKQQLQNIVQLYRSTGGGWR